MEQLESAAGQKGTKVPREKNPLQRKWVSDPTAGTKRSAFADPDARRHSQREGPQGGDTSSGSIAGPAQKYGSGNHLSSRSGQSSQESPYPPLFPSTYTYQLPQTFPQQSIQDRFLQGAKPQPGLEAHAWPFPSHLPSLASDDLFPAHSRGHSGVFPRRKSPSLPSSFSQYSQSGIEPTEEAHKKEQKPKKPGKYICPYCRRACAKPSVLKKHIRSHTGERPYPCVPCGFSFKTKSNLYKHRKSHAHAIKAGLLPFSELVSTRTDLDQVSSLGETEVHSDGEQSTETDEEVTEGTMYMDKNSPVPQISFESDKSTMEKGGEPAYADSAEEVSVASMKVPILIVPKQGIPSTAMECPQFTDIEASSIGAQGGNRIDESHTNKQKLILRLTEKKGQDSEQSLNLLSPHSKGSTDSGYFSRSESAEQQISPPNTSVKSYEEIMFGRTWYYRPNPRPRQAASVGMAAVTGPNCNIIDLNNKSGGMLELGMCKISEGHMGHLFSKDENPMKLNPNVFFRSEGTVPQMVAGCDPKQYTTSSTGLLEAPSDSGPLIRSNSMPTSSPSNLSVPQALRVSHSFDEMMTPDDVFFPGSTGFKRLTRQAAFEHSAHEGHVESDGYGNVPKNAISGVIKPGERGPFMSESKGSGLEHSSLDMHVTYGSYNNKVGMTEPVTRKRRKEKSVGEEEDCPSQYGCDHSGSVEMLSSPLDYDSKQANQETSRAIPPRKGNMYSVHSQSDSFDTAASVSSEDIVLVPDVERKAGGNVISVIQHTNSLSRPSSFEKSESIEHSYQQEKPAGQCSEQSDSENIEEMRSPDSVLRSESMDQQLSDSELVNVLSSQQYHMTHKLVRQPNIQVPEIRVTEEPDKSDKEPEVPVKEPEKHVEEFQWPQRSETLSQLPAEKLPPKKKRLRLAELEHSSGESSFESTCTSLSRSPSQESNLSHSSSFSMSFDREESIKSGSPTKQDDFGKQSEFLTVPGSGHSLSIPSHHQQREMRRSSSEQAPCALPTEIPEIRSKSFDYGSLSSSSRQGEVYTSASVMKERKRGYLVRQASLSVYPETTVQEQGLEVNVKHEQENVQSGPHLPGWHGTPSHTANEVARPKRGMPAVLGSHHNPMQQSISEDTQQEGYLHSHKSSHLPGKPPSENEHPTQESTSHDVLLYSSLHSSSAQPSFLSFQPDVFWNPESSKEHKQHLNLHGHQLQKMHNRQPSLQSPHQKSHQLQFIQEQGDTKDDGASSHSYQHPLRTELHHLSSKAFSTSAVLLQQVQPVFATQSAGLQPSLPGMFVPVRIQTHVPSYGSVMYTSVSQILATHSQSTRIICTDNTSQTSLTITSSKQGGGLNLSHLLSHPGGLLRYPLWKVPEPLPGRMNTGIPLSLTSGTISTTDASSNIGGSKRMLSPASSLELFIETKQQKRVKEETMYGQIVKELSAVELSNSNVSKDSDNSPKSDLSKNDGSFDYQEGMASPPLDFLSSKAPLRNSAPYLPEIPPAESFTPPLQIVMETPDGRKSPENLDVDESTQETSSSPQSMISSSDTQDETKQGSKMPVNMLVQLAANHGGGVSGNTLLVTDLADVQQFFQFPSLRTTTSVSWCFLNYTKPNFAQMTPLTSVYASWCISSYNPNPPSLNTKTTLGLLRSKQRKNTETYTVAAMCRPGTGKLVSSLSWKQKFDQIKPELMQLDMSKIEKKMKGVVSRDKGKEDGEKDASVKQAEPTRIKIFEGGYKSNEDYVYVRGRGRGKYICEECGIRCKKPSMLKKHIRTHTDVRPYVCKFCNFAFKTKGNLTKHMKSKAHMKKCLELGVSVTSVDDAETEEADNLDESNRESGKAGLPGLMTEHQFSDADDSEGAEDEGDEIDEDDEEDDECEGDSTPKTRSRSTSPLPYGVPSLSVTAVASSSSSSDFLGPSSKPPLFSYLPSLPSIQITQLMGPGERVGEAQMVQYQKLLQGALGEDNKSRLDVPSSMDEDLGLSPEHSSSSLDLSPSRLSSPGCDSSPLREASPTSRRYLSPRRDLSPRGRLSPRREASPLRHISPRRDLSPRGHFSPVSLGRPVSPGKDVSCRRELSPRSRHRALIRPVSPRRGLHHHGAPWALGQYLQLEMVPPGQKNRGHSSMDTNQKKHSSSHFHGEAHGGQEAPSVPQGLFSHLPLHSQQQVRTLFPMIPIGGIQMVHSVPASVTGLAHVGRLPLQKSTSEESGSGEVPLHLLPEVSSKVAEDTAQPLARTPQDGRDVADVESKQEESIQTCTNAIASLCIASEEPAEGASKSAGPLLHPHPSHLERAQVTIQHTGGSEVRQSPVGALAGPSDSITEQDDATGSKDTVTGGHSALYNESAKDRQVALQVQGEPPASTKWGKDLPDNAMDNR
ncbi:transcription factor HIVEP2 [Arapaima gigas]